MAKQTILFASNIDDPAPWQALFAKERPDVEFRVWPDIGDPLDITHALVWRIQNGVLATLPNLKAVFSLGAGIDQIIFDPDFPKDVPLFRLVDAGLREQMTEYALYGVLHWHRRMRDYARQQDQADWQMHPAVHPSKRSVGVMGMGVFGTDIAQKLVSLGFRVSGWSRSRKDVDGVESFAGDSDFGSFLTQSDILINVLPLTDETRGILSSDLFGQLPGGGALVHLGRGGHLVEADLITALDTGRLDWAMLDVFPTEPLPAQSPLWSHEKTFVTPHIAAQPVSDAAERLMIDNFNRFEQGGEPVGRVDLSVGY
ncbi:2-hydroxyacid dehydrogenase [Sagittula stellata]|uniref:D-isomer specific 2-hydroxyacid dehydrogenase, NAD-binding protein n=1 Tax=Sagittula stellata (strain ATCC 700073 / DSM 11524 / E-37) TaxID=388399 RepID=A3K4T1_SAGS3|nr:glyoxylate/hydroxypyruvate reductase A [Sagittula stellata]EBA07980.1 D-isomer specific 2-hydroxyacid dehydrogenase, NAD-binding protein [Sagittula stellata E-37]